MAISLAELICGGVRQGGIPPLRGPAMIAADQASNLGSGGRSRAAALSKYHRVRRGPDALGESAVKQVYCLRSGMIEPPVAQSFDAQVLYGGLDAGQRIDTRVRGWCAPKGIELAGESVDEQGKLALETLFEITREPRNHRCFERQAGQLPGDE